MKSFSDVRKFLSFIRLGYLSLRQQPCELESLRFAARVARKTMPPECRSQRLLPVLDRLATGKFLADDYEGFKLLASFGHYVQPGYFFADRYSPWWDEPGFKSFSERFAVGPSMSAHRKWAVLQLARLTSHVPGDTAECGVFEGATSWLICQSNLDTGKIHHMFDSFAGLSRPGPGDGPYWSKGDLAATLEKVRANLAEFDAVKYYPGWIPERFSEVDRGEFSFVHIDVDLHQPTHDSIAFFYPRLSVGGILICDDYGSPLCPGAIEAVDSYLANKPEKMVSLPDGGGFLIKGMHTAPMPLGA